MHVLPGESTDRERCVEIWLSALEHRDGRPQQPGVAARLHDHFASHIVRFAVVGRPPTAFALTLDVSESVAGSGERVALLANIAVDPTPAGRGAGRALVADAVSSATARGFAAIELAVRLGNARALALYESAGFRPTGDEPEPHPLGGPPLVRLRRAL